MTYEELKRHANGLADAIAAVHELQALLGAARTGIEPRIPACENARMIRALVYADTAMKLHRQDCDVLLPELALHELASGAQKWGMGY